MFEIEGALILQISIGFIPIYLAGGSSLLIKGKFVIFVTLYFSNNSFFSVSVISVCFGTYICFDTLNKRFSNPNIWIKYARSQCIQGLNAQEHEINTTIYRKYVLLAK